MTELEWFDSATVQEAIRAASLAWESQMGILDNEGEYVAVANALMEMVIEISTLPNEIDSLSSRELVYEAIIGAPRVAWALSQA